MLYAMCSMCLQVHLQVYKALSALVTPSSCRSSPASPGIRVEFFEETGVRQVFKKGLHSGYMHCSLRRRYGLNRSYTANSGAGRS